MSTDEFEQAMHALAGAHAHAVDVVRRATGTQAFHWASRLRTMVEAMADADAALRAEIAARIAEAEALSLRALADKLDLSKPRAQQLRARARRGDT